jgi:hypothetical protein
MVVQPEMDRPAEEQIVRDRARPYRASGTPYESDTCGSGRSYQRATALDRAALEGWNIRRVVRTIGASAAPGFVKEVSPDPRVAIGFPVKEASICVCFRLGEPRHYPPRAGIAVDMSSSEKFLARGKISSLPRADRLPLILI